MAKRDRNLPSVWNLPIDLAAGKDTFTIEIRRKW